MAAWHWQLVRNRCIRPRRCMSTCAGDIKMPTEHLKNCRRVRSFRILKWPGNHGRTWMATVPPVKQPNMTLRILSFFANKDRRTDSWVRRKKKRQLIQMSVLLSLSEQKEEWSRQERAIGWPSLFKFTSYTYISGRFPFLRCVLNSFYEVATSK